ncbi:hypothetical protein MWU54_16115 [Marivita sp. S6314]|uniref:hypothetical protein n=1 Tax=Marivita sp. S6314 TaxID=2926406 RepID=UPI001FF550D5|nr:hypothetical protein [Marivita sp. S6314]MCK0151568.1 hypothetical protein [Marivita sp. S6314]
MSVFETSTLRAAGVHAAGAVGEAVETRANIFEMTQAAEDAVLRPKDAGGVPHALRAALASRIAAQAGETALAKQYADAAGDAVALSDPAQDGGAEHRDLVAFVDKAATATKDIAAEDIARLQASGVADADIVRLCELVAFVAYQVRVAAGLRLMQGAQS